MKTAGMKRLGMVVGLWTALLGGSALAGPGGGGAGRQTEVAAMGGAVAARAQTAGVVNVNEASAEQLELLPGVGPGKAKAIIDYRKQHAFKRPEELTRIKGIGRKTFVRLRPLIALTGATTLTARPTSK